MTAREMPGKLCGGCGEHFHTWGEKKMLGGLEIGLLDGAVTVLPMATGSLRELSDDARGAERTRESIYARESSVVAHRDGEKLQLFV